MNINLSIPGISIGGTGVFLLTIAFFVMKVLGYLDWGWIWIFSPLWISFGLGLVVLLFAGFIVLIVWLKGGLN